ncbi:hypothetical protein M2451_000745 [Dysgonomonas sp. PFB1-18]|uniref:hypothetical protein n=1 Tax=unclassified Dysgonomonas TaxID=2630389 RepID=UPI002476733E|nr:MULTISPECIES: hypothetical protein [unclassified Dysgonomonas]MDH6308434.1 hypothetical protein [Dysgonomonas sp. PF1-14]MDH6337935.1 hypothetical protein [Dysgonomonas sp. PF1-16]MDH6379432.1 hypothetical protein [Dysgonomonas sp. PFB1-18]MDH6396763.1 hypothetical protein [Dysgonomonas sp. PF1-23]
MKLKEESKNKPVLTTSYVLTNGSPVTFVLYDEDGDWQLFGEEEINEDEDAYLVSIEEMLEMEPALRKLPDMQPGQAVIREKESTRWFFVEDEK